MVLSLDPTLVSRAPQMKLMNEAEKKMMQTYAYLPVYTGPDCYVVKKGLANFGPSLFQSVPATIVGWQK